jgi:GGDEF domain-containing protein
MRELFSTVTKKVVIGYLVILLFSLLAIGFALFRLHSQTRQAEQLVSVEFRAFELVRDLQQNLLAQENIEKQLLILKDPALQELRQNRNEELARYYHALTRLAVPESFALISEKIQKYRQADIQLSEALIRQNWPQGEAISNQMTAPLRTQLLQILADFRQEQQQRINSGLSDLSQQARAAYRLTLAIALIGICLSAPVAVTVVLSIHHSVRALKKATLEISDGSFEHQPKLTGKDEFAQLAQDFTRMGRKLRTLEQLRLDANPLTRLPGNLAIDREIDTRIDCNIPFSHLYIDLDNFKAYSDRYGYKAGSEVLARVGQLIQQTVREHGSNRDLIGHIGGDDYVVITTLELGEILAQKIIDEFTLMAPSFYNEVDCRAGFIAGQDRYGVERVFPLMTISIALIRSDHYDFPSRLAIGQDCARVKEFLKGQEGSNYMLDRRQ